MNQGGGLYVIDRASRMATLSICGAARVKFAVASVACIITNSSSSTQMRLKISDGGGADEAGVTAAAVEATATASTEFMMYGHVDVFWTL
jgi:hypothetical protein